MNAQNVVSGENRLCGSWTVPALSEAPRDPGRARASAMKRGQATPAKASAGAGKASKKPAAPAAAPTPSAAGRPKGTQKSEGLKVALSAAISKQDFEEAARLRDELKKLRIAAPAPATPAAPATPVAPVAQVADPKVAEPEVRNAATSIKPVTNQM